MTTSRKEDAYVSLAMDRRLRRAGVPLLDPVDKERVLIRQEGAFECSMVFDRRWGGTGCILDISITSDQSGLVVIRYIDLELPWHDVYFDWLPDPLERVPEEKNYFFPGEDGLVYPRKEVINHRRETHGKLRRGDFMKGLLLGSSPTPIPDQFSHGARIYANLRITDQLERSFSSRVVLWADRSATIIRGGRKKPPALRRRLSLCENVT